MDTLKNNLTKINPAQAGQLREFLNQDEEFIRIKIKHILEKYERKTKSDTLIPEDILKKIQSLISEEEGLNRAKEYIKEYLEHQSLLWWKVKEDKVKEKFKKEWALFKAKNADKQMQ